MIFNLVTLITAGYETSSTALTFSFYMLALHPQEEIKLQEELDRNLSENVRTN
jgi:cytochrome P450